MIILRYSLDVIGICPFKVSSITLVRSCLITLGILCQYYSSRLLIPAAQAYLVKLFCEFSMICFIFSRLLNFWLKFSNCVFADCFYYIILINESKVKIWVLTAVVVLDEKRRVHSSSYWVTSHKT